MAHFKRASISEVLIHAMFFSFVQEEYEVTTAVSVDGKQNAVIMGRRILKCTSL